MFLNSSDKEWERFGKEDPYYGVLTDERFRQENITGSDWKEFFQSGFDHVSKVFWTIRTHVDPSPNFARGLDFGCGVGRLLIPFAKQIPFMVGVDVSPSMLKECQQNCNKFTVQNIDLVLSDDQLSRLNGKFDFLHSFIVFQHIPVERGEKIFRHLLGHMSPGGVGVCQFNIGHTNRLKQIYLQSKQKFPLIGNLVNIVRGRPANSPQMQMNAYSKSSLIKILSEFGVKEVYSEENESGGYREVILYFRIPKLSV